MADLMNGSYSFEELANKYGNFQVPAARILVEGTEVLKGGSVGWTELEVTLSTGPAGIAVIKIAGAYNRETRSFDSETKNTFSLGKILQVELGYLSAYIRIFKGFIASVTMEFAESPQLLVAAMDARRLMMQAGGKARYFNEKKYADIVSAVMSPYSKLCTLEQDTTNEIPEKAIFQKISDYSFLKEVLARKLNKEFFILDDKAYFRKPGSVTGEMLTLEYEKSLLSFRRKSDYLDCKIVAAGYDKSTRAAILAEETAQNSDGQSKILSDSPEQILQQEDACDIKELQLRAAQAAGEKKQKAQTGVGRSIGLPEIVPGRYIKFTKLDQQADGKYYVAEVRHKLGSEGFYTEFETAGWI